VFTFLLITLFLARVFISKGWYIVTYALGIYHLNLFIAFLSPKIDPAMSDFEGEKGMEICVPAPGAKDVLVFQMWTTVPVYPPR